jgi:glycosyltransferase involved in cell wall biosynthesis
MIYQADDLLPDVVNKLHEDSKASNSIVLKGKVPHRELQQWYNCADFIISGSHYEGSGIAVCEAMSCGCIPIITNIASFRMMTENGKYGFLYEPGNDDQLFLALLKTQTLNIPVLREEVVAHFENKLSFKAIATKINELIKQVQ